MDSLASIRVIRDSDEEGWHEGSMNSRGDSKDSSREEKVVDLKTVTALKGGNSEETFVHRTVAYRTVKRAMDIVLSMVSIIFLSPLFLITAIAIKVEDRGPAFFTQKRVGMNGRVFSMYKFRSMKVGADEMHEDLKERYGCDEVSFKLREDPRETKIGRKIRAWNIDELPQIVNIFKGDMSFVGPRPLPIYEYEEEQKTYGGKFDLRYKVPQGLTCIWQISNRCEPDFAERMQMDVDYAKKCSIITDIKLFFQTAIYSITGKAAY